MILTDREIRLAIQEKHIEVNPTPDLSVAITSTAMDLTLGSVFKTWPEVSGLSIRPGEKEYKYSDFAKLQELWTESPHFPLKPKKSRSNTQYSDTPFPNSQLQVYKPHSPCHIFFST